MTATTAGLTAGSWCPACGAVIRSAPDASLPRVVSAEILSRPIAAALPLTHALAPRERTVFQLLGLGCDNRSIARRLRISERTVKRHVTAILTKLKLESRLQAGLAALAVSACCLGRCGDA
jgi:DNA-binding NarL/FixJ family response regulator